MEEDCIILEICAGSVTSALNAQQGGADRVELCDNLAEGGTTPAYATIAKARELLSIQLYPIIRPRGGDFLYDDLEYELMRRDISICKQLGCDGVVIGMLLADGRVDKKRCSELVELAWPMGVTFHRAFDRASNPFEALEDIISTGCERILTSGQRPTAPEGAELLATLVREADERIAIMVGSGVRENNITELVQKTGAREYHSTAQTTVAGKMEYRNPYMNEEKEFSINITDAAVVRSLREKAESGRSGGISNNKY